MEPRDPGSGGVTDKTERICLHHEGLEARLKGLEATLEARIDGLASMVREVRGLMWTLVGAAVIGAVSLLLAQALR